MHAELIVEKIELRPALANVLPRVHGARVELQQVLVNLLVNAVHAMQSTPPELRIIELATNTDADEVVVTLRDRGHGILADRLFSIFDPFYSSRPDGLGMGLSICRRIIENHGGRITASNHTDGGALFRFSLPAMPG
jgi:C4-dicarboxylate-specific signal transduction histidine kinase